jgi:polysaccharide export outer membrane protein
LIVWNRLEKPLRSQFLFVLAAAVLLSSCARKPPFEPGVHLTLVEATELPAPAVALDAGGVPEYLVGPHDKLSVNVFGVPELSRDVQVDANGRFSLPLVGSVDAKGLTLAQLAHLVETRLRGRYVRDPQVSINLEEMVSQVVSVDGQVEQPGLYPVQGTMTLMRSVALARGTTEFADTSDVVIFRTVGNQEMAALYNLGAIRRGNYPDPRVYANDVIVVGDSPGRRLFKDYLQAGGLIATPIITMLNRL